MQANLLVLFLTSTLYHKKTKSKRRFLIFSSFLSKNVFVYHLETKTFSIWYLTLLFFFLLFVLSVYNRTLRKTIDSLYLPFLYTIVSLMLFLFCWFIFHIKHTAKNHAGSHQHWQRHHFMQNEKGKDGCKQSFHR